MNEKRARSKIWLARDKKPVTVAIIVRVSMHQGHTRECDLIFSTPDT